MSKWGFNSVNSGSAAIGTATAEVLGANADRRGVVLSNPGTIAVSLALGTAAAVSGEGIVIEGGEQYEMSRGWGNLWSGAIQGVASQDGAAIAYSEGE
jgi:hypothetical protein